MSENKEYIQFKYSKDGIDALKKFCGENVTLITNKYRHITAIGTAEIFYIHGGIEVKYLAVEGDYFVRSFGDGHIFVLDKVIFEGTWF